MGLQIQNQFLEFCVLAIVERADVYGYQLTQELMNSAEISESTLYPVLRRLSEGGYLSTYDKAFDGRNRRYYTVTELGKAKLISFKSDWKKYIAEIEKITGGETSDKK